MYRKGFSLLAAVIVVLFIILIEAGSSQAVRLKDIAGINGMRTNQIIGYGLVVGLNGTGDGTQADFTIQSIVNMMERMGVTVNPQKIKVKNVAGVMVTAQMSPFNKVGQKLDVVVSSLGDAKSLQGGTLLLTPLKGVDGKVYALAQGPVSVGGFAVQGAAERVQKNHPTVGRIANGATVEREIPVAMNERSEILINLNNADFTTVSRAARAINSVLRSGDAKAIDAETIRLTVPPEFRGNITGLMAAIENVEIKPDQPAKVVLDERTGTVVVGSEVKISSVAISHGNLSIQVKESPQVSQPQPFSQGATVVTPNTQTSVQEGGGGLVVVNSQPTIGDLAKALNAMGVTPRDLIAIFTSLKAVGALQADLEII
ncbi:MAG: flagellar basal body P-ring protein FlgI [Dissulfurimicrobium sp.]|uniref:flagellar basal body P-ring protein FlgI n=1 Tax=Dissulfurimicrobium sp. TaxID=2022436 RepID=UPI00404A0EC2